MEWHFKGIARKSSLSRTPFVSGDRVACIIFKDYKVGEIGRMDLLMHEVDTIDLPGEILGRWMRVVKDPDEEGTSVRETVASAEECFLSLYAHAQSGAEDELAAMKHLLALMLERKRVLRAVGKRHKAGTQSYIHVKTKQMVDVPIVEISADLMLRIQDTLGDIIV